MGKTKGRPRSVDDEEVAMLYRTGLSYKLIAEKLHVGLTAVAHSVRRSGINRRPGRPAGKAKPAAKKKVQKKSVHRTRGMRQMASDGMPLLRIAVAYNTTAEDVMSTLGI